MNDWVAVVARLSSGREEELVAVRVRIVRHGPFWVVFELRSRTSDDATVSVDGRPLWVPSSGFAGEQNPYAEVVDSTELVLDLAAAFDFAEGRGEGGEDFLLAIDLLDDLLEAAGADDAAPAGEDARVPERVAVFDVLRDAMWSDQSRRQAVDAAGGGVQVAEALASALGWLMARVACAEGPTTTSEERWFITLAAHCASLSAAAEPRRVNEELRAVLAVVDDVAAPKDAADARHRLRGLVNGETGSSQELSWAAKRDVWHVVGLAVLRRQTAPETS